MAYTNEQANKIFDFCQDELVLDPPTSIAISYLITRDEEILDVIYDEDVILTARTLIDLAKGANDGAEQLLKP